MLRATCRLAGMDQGWERVAAKVTAERVRRGYRSLAEFAKATGLSTTTVDAIEHARIRVGAYADVVVFDPATIATLEHALGWEPGSIERIRKGLQPTYDDDPDLTALIDVWHKLSPGSRRMLRLLAQEAAKAE